MVQFSKLSTNDEQRLVFGLASVAVTADGETVTDLQGDQISQDELESAFYDYVLESREGDAMHDQQPTSTLVESFVVTPAKLDMLLKALGHEGAPPDFKGVAAWVGYKVHRDDVWKRVKSGELGAFSIEGTAEREEVEKGDEPGHPFRGNQWTSGEGGGGDDDQGGSTDTPARRDDFARFTPRVLGVYDPVRIANIARVAAKIEADRGYKARDEAGMASVLRQALKQIGEAK